MNILIALCCSFVIILMTGCSRCAENQINNRPRFWHDKSADSAIWALNSAIFAQQWQLHGGLLETEDSSDVSVGGRTLHNYSTPVELYDDSILTAFHIHVRISSSEVTDLFGKPDRIEQLNPDVKIYSYLLRGQWGCNKLDFSFRSRRFEKIIYYWDTSCD
jgi:hypothetical protein